MSKALAFAWLGLVLLAGASLFIQRQSLPARIEADLFALLPREQRDPLAEAAFAALAKRVEGSLVVLLGHQDAAIAEHAARQLRSKLAALPLKPAAPEADFAQVQQLYAPFRAGLITPQDLALLESETPAYWRQRALAAAYSPIGSLLPWRDDPFGLFGNWLAQLVATSKLRPQGDLLVLEHSGVHYVALLYVLQDSAFSIQRARQVQSGLELALREVQVPGLQVERAGVLLHAALASQRAEAEVSLIGLGSTLGTLLLALLVFRSLRALAVVVLSLAVGCLLAFWLCLLCYAKVQLLTLVFGASLVGISLDYGMHVLCASINDRTPPRARLRALMPGLLLAMLTTVLAFFGLLLSPMPGLAQMALFAITGILSAWLTVLLWFPVLAPAYIARSKFAGWVGALLPRWPRFSMRSWWWFAPLLAVTLLGLQRVRSNDDVRALASVDPQLRAEQMALEQRLGLPSPAQMLVLTGADPEALLQACEALEAKLAPLIAAGKLSGYQAICQFLPSQQRQRAAAQLRQARLAAPGMLDELAEQLGLSPAWLADQRAVAPVLEFDQWWQNSAAKPLHFLLTRDESAAPTGALVLLSGLREQATVRELAGMANSQLRWIDKPARITEVFARSRNLLTMLLLLSYLLTAIALHWRYRRDSWRVLAPAALASVFTLAVFGWLGIPVQLLNVLALLLLLGMGVDYGIFLCEHPEDQRAFLAITLAALSTVLSFGLLAFSSTPGLSAFGLSSWLSVSFAWLLAPLFRRPLRDAERAHA